MDFTALAHSITGKSLDECSVEELKQLTSAYPYFAPAQFLLVEKLKITNDPDYGETASRAALFYHNVLKLDQILNADKFVNHFVPTAPPKPQIEDLTEPRETTQEFVSSEPEQSPVSTELNESTESNGSNHSPESIEAVRLAGLPDATQSINKTPEAESSTPPNTNNTTNTINTTDTTNTLTFEPYHMVDYFASQGIKLSREEETKDNFGKQLKSFTEWLKSMKKLPVSQMVAHLDSSSENKVVNLAEHSVNEPEVLTESMAEVWLKQGNKQKAIAIYNKLSLQNPSKKPYFAALIEKLK